MIAEVLNSFALNLDFLRKMVADVADERMTCQPKGVVNHPAWTIGHLVFSCQQIGEEIGVKAWLEGRWREQFGTGSKPSSDASKYPGKSALLKALHDAQ